jgi:type IV secretory pathway TrbD component
MCAPLVSQFYVRPHGNAGIGHSLAKHPHIAHWTSKKAKEKRTLVIWPGFDNRRESIMSSDGNTMKMNKSARVLIVILAAGLVAGIAGFVEHGWQHGDTIGAAVWLLVAMLFVLAIRHKSPRRP